MANNLDNYDDVGSNQYLYDLEGRNSKAIYKRARKAKSFKECQAEEISKIRYGYRRLSTKDLMRDCARNSYAPF